MQGVEVSMDFVELQNRANRLRHRAEAVIAKTKEKLEQVGRESGLPVGFTLTVKMKFAEPMEPKKGSKGEKQGTPK